VNSAAIGIFDPVETGQDDRATVAVVVLIGSWVVALRVVLIGGHRPNIGRIDAVGQLEQAAAGGLLDEMVEYLVNDVFEVGEKAIDRVSGRRSITPTTQSDHRISKLSFNGTNAVDVVVVAMEEATHQL